MQSTTKPATKPIDVLSGEHRVIEVVLDAVERIAESARKTRKLDVESAQSALKFIRNFADRCHHGKEEELFFKKLHERGMPRGVGPVAVMLDEHEIGRRLVRDMGQAVEACERGDADAVTKFADRASEYVELLRDHIAKEDGVLFPMGDAMLRDEDRAALFESFAKFEVADMGAGVHQEMEAIATSLAARYGVAPAADRGAPSGGGCCHGAHGSCH
ncbi:MAG: hemerythrin domain-containing protein [Planctomycetes bacterium]|nr:hemerythrin domain-containing protein [Planctomycetota bacterium]